MEILPTKLAGTLLIQPKVHGDSRGFFAETFRTDFLADHGINARLGPGQPLALVPRACWPARTSRPRPGQR